MKEHYDFIIIGAGSAGLTAAVGAAGIGASVLLIEKHKIGGDCTHYGCVPSKALIHASKTVSAHTIEARVTQALEHAQAAVTHIADEESPKALAGLGIDVELGNGVLRGKRRVAVNDKIYSGRKIIIATGSRPQQIPIKGLDDHDYLTNKSIFSTKSFTSLAILGGGPIGSELAQSFARLGVKVHLIDRANQVLSREDTEASSIVADSMQRLDITLHLESEITHANKQGNKKTLHITQSSGTESTVSVDEVLVAAGRQPNVEHIGLDDAGIDYSNQGIAINKRGQTSQRHTYAIGDAAGPPFFTHRSNHHAKQVLTHAIFKLPTTFNEAIMPRVTFTTPEIASIGMTEAELEQTNTRYIVLKKPLSEMDRGITDNVKNGFFKLLVNKRGKIFGATLVGNGAGELIGEIALAMNHGIKISQLADTIHPYPTYGYGLRQTADLYRAQTYSPAKRSFVQKLFRLHGKT